ncbi:SNF-related serine/threonine-protein kinase isoform 1-T2 [Menidia menidia]
MAGFKRGYDGKIAGLYDLDKTLGRGHFAVVKLARHVFTGEKVAVKVIDKTKLDTAATGHLFQEVRCMKLVQHPNIVRLYEVIDTQTKLYLILELGDGGDMFDYIMKHDEGLNEDLAKKYFAQIVHAISYCHRLHVVHRDLKPENVVFFEKQGLVKLTDFGFSNKFQPGKKLTTSCGSLAYSAPEILLGDEYDAPAVDIWSLGVILFMLVSGQPPFQEANDSETLTMIMDCKYTVPARVSSDCKNLIDRMLQRDPKCRASLEEIEKHKWLQGVDPSPATKYNTPLVSHRNLSEDEHNSIIQRMVLGDIADRENIVDALETNKYNHITATYYLLAERILREKQMEVQTRSSSPSNVKTHFRQSWPTRAEIHQDIEDGLSASSISQTGGPQSPARSSENLLNGHRAKGRLDLSQREEFLVNDPVEPPSQGDCAAILGPAPASVSETISAPTPSTSADKQKISLFRLDEDEEEEEEQDPSPLPPQVILRRKPPSITNRLTSRKSAPVLNQIFEEGESDDDFDLNEALPPKLSRLKMSVAGNASSVNPGATSSSSPRTTQKRYNRRKSQGRGSSCSSSETSDDDSESHRRRLDKDSGFGQGWKRRDSSEGPPGSDGGNGGGNSSGQGKPPPEGDNSSGTDKGSPSGAGSNGAGDGGGGGGGFERKRGVNKGHNGTSSCNGSSTKHSLRSLSNSSRMANHDSEIVESLRLMSLCFCSHLQHHCGGPGGQRGSEGTRFFLEPCRVNIQEKSPWKMSINSPGSLDTVTLPTTITSLSLTHATKHHHCKTVLHSPLGLQVGSDSRNAHSNPSAMKNNMLQLPLYEKTISVNIQRTGGSRDGLLCTSAAASCCHVI